MQANLYHGVSIGRNVPTNFKKYVQLIICQLHFNKIVKTHISMFTHIHEKTVRNVQNLHKENTPKRQKCRREEMEKDTAHFPRCKENLSNFDPKSRTKFLVFLKERS